MLNPRKETISWLVKMFLGIQVDWRMVVGQVSRTFQVKDVSWTYLMSKTHKILMMRFMGHTMEIIMENTIKMEHRPPACSPEVENREAEDITDLPIPRTIAIPHQLRALFAGNRQNGLFQVKHPGALICPWNPVK